MNCGWKFLLVSVLLLVEKANGRGCSTDLDCSPTTCCIEILPYIKRCRDRPDDPGDVCGGRFSCSCINGLQCVKHSPSAWNPIKFGYGTCQHDLIRQYLQQRL